MSALHHARARLFPQELRDVVRSAASLARDARAFPAAKRLYARPCAGGRASTAIHVEHAGFHLVEESIDLSIVVGEQTARQTELRSICFFERLIERFDDADRGAR